MRGSWLNLIAGSLGLSIGMPVASAQTDKPQAATLSAGVREARPTAPRDVLLQLPRAFECKGGLNLEKFDDDAEALDQVDLWDRVGERLASDEMPPKKSKQPTDDERRTLLAWVRRVDESQVTCEDLTPEQLAQSLSGHTNTRRLNRTEYNNTLRDLFGVDLHAGDLLPSEGGGGEGFDNAGATLFITPMLLEKYLEAAELALSTLPPAQDSRADKAQTDHAESQATASKGHSTAVAGRDPSTMRPSARIRAREFWRQFLPRAFRRPAGNSEIERYLAIFDKANERNDRRSSKRSRPRSKAVLIAPSFLF